MFAKMFSAWVVYNSIDKLIIWIWLLSRVLLFASCCEYLGIDKQEVSDNASMKKACSLIKDVFDLIRWYDGDMQHCRHTVNIAFTKISLIDSAYN